MMRRKLGGSARWRGVYVDWALDNLPVPRVEVGRDPDLRWVAFSFGARGIDPVIGVSVQWPARRG